MSSDYTTLSDVCGCPLDPEERQIWCGRELLAALQEMFDDSHLGLLYDFDRWVDAAPLPPAVRDAIARARVSARGQCS